VPVSLHLYYLYNDESLTSLSGERRASARRVMADIVSNEPKRVNALVELDADGGVITEIRPSDGYVNATKLCASARKFWGNHWECKKAKKFASELSELVGMPTSALVKYEIKLYERATWVHPRVATHLACWISSEFGAKVTGWIEMAKQKIPEIKTQYDHSLASLKPDAGNDCIESIVRDRLATQLSGETEVTATYGPIDVMSNTEVIEVKHAPLFTRALGQVLGHGKSFPQKRKRIHIFGSESEIEDNLELAKRLCADYDVLVTHEVVDCAGCDAVRVL
jgi:hypothetical protein